MVTPAEEQLVQTVASLLHQGNCRKLLNLGAGKSVVLESSLADKGCSFKCDRLDIEDCTVNHPNVAACLTCSAENMSPLESDSYDIVFSNYVLEHIVDIDAAIREIARVLKPKGLFVGSIPNPQAPEFVVARGTPLWFHRLVRGGTGWHTRYSFHSIKALSRVFSKAGMETISVSHYSFLRQYFEKLGPLMWPAAAYDSIAERVGWKRLMGNVCLVAQKT